MYIFLKRPCIDSTTEVPVTGLNQTEIRPRSTCVGPDVPRALVQFSPNPGSIMVHSVSVCCQRRAPEVRKLKVVHVYTWFPWSSSRDPSSKIHSVPSDLKINNIEERSPLYPQLYLRNTTSQALLKPVAVLSHFLR